MCDYYCRDKESEEKRSISSFIFSGLSLSVVNGVKSEVQKMMEKIGVLLLFVLFSQEKMCFDEVLGKKDRDEYKRRYD